MFKIEYQSRDVSSVGWVLNTGTLKMLMLLLSIWLMTRVKLFARLLLSRLGMCIRNGFNREWPV
jgi:hypothetical protein